MPRFAANLTMLFTELPFLDRFDAAAKAGFTAVEFLFPYDFPVAEIGNRLVANRLQLVLHNLPAGDWDAGERGIACLPDRVAEFRDGVARAIDYASALGAPQMEGYGVDHEAVVTGLGCKFVRVHRQEEIAPAIKQAEAWLVEHRVPVVIERLRRLSRATRSQWARRTGSPRAPRTR